MIVDPLVEKAYPFQVSVYHTKTVHVFQPGRSIDQLNRSVVPALTRYKSMTYKLDTIDPFRPLHELVDVTMVHPFGYHCKAVLFQVHTE